MFIFRNNTIENLFPEDKFSGYEDISYIPEDEKELIWFYQAPINFFNNKKAEIINSFIDKLLYVKSMLKEGQCLYICSLIDVFPTNIVDTDNLVSEAIDVFNAKAKTLAESDYRIKFIDIREYFSQFSQKEWINWKYYFISQMIFSPKVAEGFNSWFFHRISQIKGYRKKCLILDLDNTLWGGILGEDGINGIKIGGDYPGNVYLYFQEALLSLADTGIILTVCSKNNESDVKELWEKNPFNKITSENLTAWRINWNNKADNIREIAKDLNIGLDSMVFIDDNPTERELIRKELPMVSTPDFPSKPYDLIPFIREIELLYFRVTSLTAEDLSKKEQYKANYQRNQSLKNFTDIDSFIRSLEIQIDIFNADSFTIPRISQMTQKTNQFNLTTRRYQESDIQNILASGDMVIGAKVKDKFGDNGITAAIILNLSDSKAHIDSFLLSCRILGKGIEEAFLFSVLNELRKKGIKEVTAEYIPSLKNIQVSSFYSKCGFKKIKSEINGDSFYRMNLKNPIEIKDSYKININI